MSLDRRKPLDHAFLEGMRDRIEVAAIIDKLQDFVRGDVRMRPEQVKAAEILLRKCIPDLKSVEHTDGPKRDLTREQLIERLTQLHSGAIVPVERPAVGGAGAVDGATEIQH